MLYHDGNPARIGRPQEAPQGPPLDSLALDEQAMEEDRMVWQQLANHPQAAMLNQFQRKEKEMEIGKR